MNKYNPLFKVLFILFYNITLTQETKDLIIFQGFYWEVYNEDYIKKERGLYNFLNNKTKELKKSQIDLIYLPPPSKGDQTPSMGYHPTELYNFNSSFGTEKELKELLKTLKKNKIHPMADLILNHRSGTTQWADFTNPYWGCEAIVMEDEVSAQRNQLKPCSNERDEGLSWGASRDLNHKSPTVQNGIMEYLKKLRDIGFDSWRYDFVKGYPGKYVKIYNDSSKPYFSVGERLIGESFALTNWIKETENSSAAFDFDTYYKLGRALKQNYYAELLGHGESQMIGLAGTQGYSDKAVTFVDNHDTCADYQTILGDDIMKAYAYILTHPGIPCIFMQHYYGGSFTKNFHGKEVSRTYISHKKEIDKLIAIRKKYSINANSTLKILKADNEYIASIDDKVLLYLGKDTAWKPNSNKWECSVLGKEYAIWIKNKL